MNVLYEFSVAGSSLYADIYQVQAGSLLDIRINVRLALKIYIIIINKANDALFEILLKTHHNDCTLK